MYSLFVCVSLTLMLGSVYTLPDVSLLLNSRVLSSQTCDNSYENFEILGCNSNCTGLRICSYGEMQEVDCKAQNGMSYCNPDSHECVARPTLCPAPLGEFKCPASVGEYPDPLDCTVFYSCLHNVPIKRQCVDGMYNANLRKCEIGTTCYTFSPTYGLCRNKTGKMVGHPQAPDLYAYCAEDYPILGSCPFCTEFNENVSGCQYKCIEIGLFPDCVDWHKYYICKKDETGFVATHASCPTGTVFYPGIDTCL